MSELPFQPECYFDCPEDPVMHVDFRSGHSAFLCEEHFARAQAHDQCTDQRNVFTGIERIIKAWDEGLGLI